ncbi:MAG TPA: ABC transporter ATP-binding protein [Nitrososphaerales archaeon]|nr:ABC transporter ATP-binding protein [Nitrososphaerales archaeon]
MSVIQFSDAIKDYGSGKRIGPVSLSVNEGEILGFLGPNGSGKTTCIRLLLGLMRPTSGSVSVRGLDPVSEHRKALVNVGYSPELPNIQTFLTPRELLALTAEELIVPKAEVSHEIASTLEIVGLTEYTNVKVSKLSKGMVQRLSIAQALIGTPDLLVMDEPMIGLDPAGAAHFREVFRRIAKERGGTIFLSSHIMSEVESLCTSVCMIHRGRMLFNGTIKETIGNVLGSTFLIVEAEPVENCLESIRGISGVEEVRRMDGSRTVELKVTLGKDVRPNVAEAVIRSGAKLYSLSYSEDLLERTYLEALKKGTNF